MENITKARENYKRYGIANLTVESWVDSMSGKKLPLKEMVNDFEELMKPRLHSNINIGNIQRINPLIKINKR